jgi:hypothetical protein
VVVGTTIAFVFNGFVLTLLLHPLHTVLAHSQRMGRSVIEPTERTSS